MNDLILSGVVVSLKANFFEVEIDLLEQNLSKNVLGFDASNYKLRLLSTCRNRLYYESKYVRVGDNVIVGGIDLPSKRAVILEIKPRINFLERPSLANISKAFVTLSLDSPVLDIQQATRFLLTAEKSNLNISLILTKSDLLSKEELSIQLDRLSKWGYNYLAVSIKTAQGLESLYNLISQESLSVFCGPSGVGKTSLINQFLSEKALPVGSLSTRIKRGKNTTRHVELFSLANGARIADTPGFNKPEVIFKPIDLQYFFKEITSQSTFRKCKFRNCLHRNEYGCNIDKNWERYPIYKSLLSELNI